MHGALPIKVGALPGLKETEKHVTSMNYHGTLLVK